MEATHDYTRGIAAFVSGLQYAAIPPEVRERIKLLVLDALGCALYGALFAEQGFTGIENLFESEYGGFCTTFSRSTDRFDLAQLTAGLGTVWQTLGVALKFYACVGSNHTTLDALRELQAVRRFGASDVEKIVVHGSQVTMDHVGWKYRPQGLTAAQLNLSYCVATWLLEGDCFIDQFTEAAVADPARMALAERVEVRHDDAITAKGANFRHAVRVEVTLRSGERLQCEKESPRGSETNFANTAELVEKFEKLAARALPRARVAELRDAVLGMERLPDASRIAALMSLDRP